MGYKLLGEARLLHHKETPLGGSKSRWLALISEAVHNFILALSFPPPHLTYYLDLIRAACSGTCPSVGGIPWTSAFLTPFWSAQLPSTRPQSPGEIKFGLFQGWGRIKRRNPGLCRTLTCFHPGSCPVCISDDPMISYAFQRRGHSFQNTCLIKVREPQNPGLLSWLKTSFPRSRPCPKAFCTSVIAWPLLRWSE